MKKYFVIHSSDPYLLARLCTDLQMEIHNCVFYGNPFEQVYMGVYNYGYCKFIQFLNHITGDTPTRPVTEDNYLTILKQIL